ncbi:uncharacterized protein FA14DRAFT_85672 [Meira miltonrushii]|uniref:DUF7904 domain-containing protein n=1 Tax=Meira miltonrushii TaxID=1280837 RepID=A0A316V6R2_9BASI|nr:uncharacterized protein FA14DRAFT_85672 [Meira miltonrushii]PWN32181.1 hypothetical protein FA14DRAFT_85672 [Meira miltonrushii]
MSTALSPNVTGGSGVGNHRSAFGVGAEGGGGNSGSTADELEEEVRRAREERLRRRNQLSGGGSLSSSSRQSPQLSASESPSPANPSSSLSGEETLRKLLGERGIKSPTLERSIASPSMQSSPVMQPKSNSLLDRYGGASGPTGVAKAGTQGQSVSLASFMGGKASGPRLGKLAGDGRNAPPEADLIDTSRHALPGLASGRPIPGQNTSSASGMGASPLANFLEARAASKTGSAGVAPQARSPSPVKLAESEVKRFSYTSPAEPQPTETKPLSPVRIPNSTQTENVKTQGQDLVSPRLHDASTSPFKPQDLHDAKTLDAPLKSASQSKAGSSALSPGSIVHSPTADALSRFPPVSQHSPAVSPSLPQEPNMSPAFMATQQNNERQPTESLTRLRSKRMVEQRVREAQERGQQESGASSPGHRSPAAEEGSAQSAKAFWSAGANQINAPQQARSLPIPGRMSNALPGLGGQHGGSGAPRNLYAVNRKTPEEEAAAFAQPVRLPGMGSAASPFAARKMTEEKDDDGEVSKPLQSLTAGRARPKKAFSASTTTRSSAPAPQYATSSIVTPQHEPSPKKEDLHLQTSNIHERKPQIRREDSASGPDSAAKIADSTAALEALLEGRSVKTPPPTSSKASVGSKQHVRPSGTLKIARSRSEWTKVDHSALLHSAPPIVRANPLNRKLVSLEVALIGSNGSTTSLKGQDAATLYETETQVITHRFKDSAMSAIITTNVYARVGRLSPIVTGSQGAEARKLMEIAQQNRVPVIDARQGRESLELAQVLGGTLITKEGSRNTGRDNSDSNTTTFQVRGVQGGLFIDQVDSLTSSLCSSLSVIVELMGDVFVWHGMGSVPAIREGALQYAKALSPQAKKIAQYEEGSEDELFWTCFDRATAYSNAWHHQFLPLLREDQLANRLYNLQVQGSIAKVTEQTPFSALDIKRDGVYLLQLPMELYILIGPDARSHRNAIGAMIEAASVLSRHIAQQRGSTIMTAPIHVLTFPSIVPREVRSAFRYWHDEHLNGKRWQRMQLRMNITEKREAVKQLEKVEHDVADLEDDLFLPVGVGLDDVKGIDV